jgi:hypothetical protein
MVQFLQDSIDDLTSNEDEDIDSEDKPLNLWPLLFQKQGPELSTHSCKLKSGQAGYKKPITNPLSTSGKLVPQPLPRQTKHNYHKNFIKAVGKGNTIMDNFLIKTPNTTSSAASHPESSVDVTPVPDLPNALPDIKPASSESLNKIKACLETHLNNHFSTPQTVDKSKNIQIESKD